MDTEQTCQLFTQAQIRCLILEADRDAESLRADKYRKILDTVIGEGSPDAAESQTARSLHAARDPLPTSDPVALTMTQRPSTNPSVVSRERNPSIAKNPAQISKRPSLALNASIASTYSSTFEPRSPQMLVLVTAGKNAPVVHVAGILRNAGLTSLELTRAETICAKRPPELDGTPSARLLEAVENVTIQPFMPLDTGKPGLVLRLPIVAELSQNEKSTFHVLTTMTQGRTLYYRGKYAKIPLPQLQFKWENLSHKFKERWIRRAQMPAMRALRARIELRNIQKREPVAAEVEEYSRLHFEDQMTFRQVSAAFQSGDEKLVVDGIYCTAYDSQLATMIQRTV